MKLVAMLRQSTNNGIPFTDVQEFDEAATLLDVWRWAVRAETGFDNLGDSDVRGPIQADLTIQAIKGS